MSHPRGSSERRETHVIQTLGFSFGYIGYHAITKRFELNDETITFIDLGQLVEDIEKVLLNFSLN
ncbi:hypothetical protein D3C77_276990 [compost metagenome]